MKRFSSKKLVKVFFVVAISGLLIFFNPRNFFDPARSFLGKTAYPFQLFFYSISYEMNKIVEFLGSIDQLKEENNKIMIENRNLLAENVRLRDMERENSFLREQIDLIPRGEFNLEAAFIIGQDPQGFGNWIEINKGSSDDLHEGMAVVVSNGILIGKIQQVFTNRSMVMLLSNPKSAIGVMISESGAKGITKGEYGLGVMMDSILQTDSVIIGNEVVTSGIGGNIPRGLFVGIVQEVRSSSDHLFQQAIILSPVSVSKLETVFVIKSEK